MTQVPEIYSSCRSALDFDEVPYGVGGIALCTVDQLESAQIGYSVDPSGRSLVDTELGSWSASWIVVGNETACGDPIFLSIDPPHAVFTAMHGEGEWLPNLIAPSLDRFWQCLERFRKFGASPSDEEIKAYLTDILALCDGIPATVEFWAIQAEIGMDDEGWRVRLESFLDNGKLD